MPQPANAPSYAAVHGRPRDLGPWMPTAPCTPEDCVAGAVPAVGRFRRFARRLAVVGIVVAGVVLSPFVRRFPPARRDRLVARWARWVVAAFGIRIRLSGTAAPAAGVGVLVVANHVSWLDIPLAAAVRPGRMLAKSDIASWPVLGPLAARGGTIFLDRERLRTLPDTVATMASALREGTAVVAFPEGSTWCGQAHGRFRNAVFQAALDAGVPVQPLRIRYRLEPSPRARRPLRPAADGAGVPTAVTAYVGEDTLLASLRRVVAARGLVAEVTVLPCIPPGAHADRRSLARAAAATVSGRSWASGDVGVGGERGGGAGELVAPPRVTVPFRRVSADRAPAS